MRGRRARGVVSDRDAPRLPVELALLGLLALLWGSSYLFIKIAVQTVPPVTLIAARVSIAALVLLAVLAWRGERLPRDGRTWGLLLVQAFLNSIGAWTVLAWGQQYVDSGLASVLNSTSPIFVFLFTLGAASGIDVRKLLGACIGLAGVVLVIGPDVLDGLGQALAGQAAILIGAILYAGAAIFGRRLIHLPATVTAAGTMIWAVAWLVPLAVVVDRPWTLAPSWPAIASIVVLGTFCTGLALLVYFRLIRTLGSMGTSSQSYLRAGIGVVLGMAVLGETVTPLIGLGLLASIAGVMLINLPGRAVRG